MRRTTARRDVRLLTLTERGELAFDVGPDPRTIGVVLRLAGPAPPEAEIAATLADRLADSPRWSCRVVRPPGLLPRWEPMAVDTAAHVRTLTLAPGDGAREDDVMAAAVRVLREPWDLKAAPPWRVTRLVTGTGRDAVVLSLHHVLTDGTGVLATGAALLGMTPPLAGSARAAPESGGAAAHEPGAAGAAVRAPARAAAHSPASAVAHALGAVRTVALGVAELAAGLGPRAERTSLSAPIEPGFCLANLDLDLDGVRRSAHHHGATVNDVLLVAGAGAVARLLARRGERVDRILCSVPVSRARPGDTDRRARTGVLRVAAPVAAPATAHGRPGPTASALLLHTAARTRRRRRFATGESAPLLAFAFESLGRLGLYRAVLRRQRLINMVVSNLRGPAEPMAIAGVPVTHVMPIAPGVGNVPVYVTALSYAGRLSVTLRVEARLASELPGLAADVRDVVDELASARGPW
ncbi:WS/DGAT domain-containing protein [Xylanimonas ulmi]|uniref:diacylglycerol O-acyltransferase n=1 Tax=Xylanimonas ulmi TaxID=228973 RepID=A0A4V2EXN9_9MICO|nr:WS/DGAT domain-containing protein [Xylanibacterium ulmi]RZS60150.1 wax ester synthase-like acyl-CoA acyltransferase family protein [Xylanibacterium ulmi]